MRRLNATVKLAFYSALLCLLIAGVAESQADILYVSNSGNNTIEKISSGSVSSTFATTSNTGPEGLAFDSSANLYASFYTHNVVQKFNTAGAGSTLFTLNDSTGNYSLAFDSSGNLFAANSNPDAGRYTAEKITPGGTVSTFATLPGFFSGEAFDSAGNLYVDDLDATEIIKLTNTGMQSVFASGISSGLRGLAFDSAGYLYAADFTNNKIIKYSPAGVPSSFASTGLNNPLGLAFDSVGNLYAANYGNNTIEEYNSAGVGSVFATTGLNQPTFLAFTTDAGVPVPLANQVPEPTSIAIVGLAIACSLRRRCRAFRPKCGAAPHRNSSRC